MSTQDPLTPRTVIRRRGGREVSRTIVNNDGERRLIQALDAGATHDTTAARRVQEAARRMEAALEGSRAVSSTVSMRDDQKNVFEDFARCLEEAAAHLLASPADPAAFMRVVQPPRTGKTIIMGEFISATGATAVVLVPSKTLVRQTVKSLRKQLPTVRVGAYYGDKKNAAHLGVTVATYHIVQRHQAQGILPDSIARATLVFCDEGHKAMSDARLKMLKEAFLPGALRVFFTATPDYNEIKTLASVAPKLIHEITVAEALELKLFADLNVKVVSIHADGSKVEVIGKDFDHGRLGRLMSGLDFFEATRQIRWKVGTNAQIPTLICCASRKQARKLQEYLCEHLPSGAPMPALVLGNTPNRDEILDAFERGEIDTLINVGVLIEGWNSPRCKLLIDLDPSLSEVRAKQKYFRVMTRNGDETAYIYVLVPDQLSRIPIFPQTLFGLSVDVEGYADWIGRQPRSRGNTTTKPEEPDLNKKPSKKKPFAPPSIEARVLHTFTSDQIRLDPRDLKSVRQVIETQFSVTADIDSHIPRFGEFVRTWFETEVFSGYGAHLMRYCGVPLRRKTFRVFLSRIFPDIAADRFLRDHGWGRDRIRLDLEDVNYLATAGTHSLIGSASFTSPLNPYSEGYDLEEAVDQIRLMKRLVHELSDAGRILTPQQRRILHLVYLDPEFDTITSVSRETGLSAYRINQIVFKALERLRDRLQRKRPPH